MHYTISTQFLVCLKLLFLFTGKLLLRNDKIEKYRESIGDPGDQSKSVQFFAFINLVLSFRLNQFKMVVCVCVWVFRYKSVNVWAKVKISRKFYRRWITFLVWNKAQKTTTTTTTQQKNPNHKLTELNCIQFYSSMVLFLGSCNVRHFQSCHLLRRRELTNNMVIYGFNEIVIYRRFLLCVLWWSGLSAILRKCHWSCGVEKWWKCCGTTKTVGWSKECGVPRI